MNNVNINDMQTMTEQDMEHVQGGGLLLPAVQKVRAANNTNIGSPTGNNGSGIRGISTTGIIGKI